MTTRRFYAPSENFKDATITLDAEQTRHLRDVLRLRASENAQIFDGDGKEFLCEIETIERKETRLKVIREISPTAPESDLDLTLAVGLLKGEKLDLVAQKAVELGVAKLVPLNTKRADVKFTSSEKRVERWRKIIIDATKQCGRARLMEISEPLDFENFIETANGARILFVERGGESFSQVKSNQKMIAVVGAEGGWETAEIEAARAHGFQIITLLGRILRAETAAISIATILQHRFGDLK